MRKLTVVNCAGNFPSWPLSDSEGGKSDAESHITDNPSQQYWASEDGISEGDIDSNSKSDIGSDDNDDNVEGSDEFAEAD